MGSSPRLRVGRLIRGRREIDVRTMLTRMGQFPTRQAVEGGTLSQQKGPLGNLGSYRQEVMVETMTVSRRGTRPSGSKRHTHCFISNAKFLRYSDVKETAGIPVLGKQYPGARRPSVSECPAM